MELEPKHYLERKVTIPDTGTPRQWKVVAVERDPTNLNRELLVCMYQDGDAPPVFARRTSEKVQLVPEPEERTAHRRAGYQAMSALSATPDESLEWFAFVMLQAASLFEGIPSPGASSASEHLPDASREELTRLLTVRGENPDGPVVAAALAYYDAACDWYKADEERD